MRRRRSWLRRAPSQPPKPDKFFSPEDALSRARRAKHTFPYVAAIARRKSCSSGVAPVLHPEVIRGT
jgi:hypothetical protein